MNAAGDADVRGALDALGALLARRCFVARADDRAAIRVEGRVGEVLPCLAARLANDVSADPSSGVTGRGVVQGFTGP